MTPDSRDKLDEIYSAALKLDAGRRAEFVRQACGSDSALRSEIESLLAHDEQLGSFLEIPAIGAVSEGMAQAAQEPLVGQTLGPYQVESLLGSGGMGTVYRARDTRLGRAVAIKLADKEFGDRFLTEARAVAALNHPHVCTLYDVGPNYLVMELVEGETLARSLRNGALPLPLIMQYGIEIADSLTAAHAQGIIHRDLKPGNIMITKAGIKVLDFGLAKLPVLAVGSAREMPTTSSKAGPKSSGGIVGTAAYMSPEQARGEELDARSDLFSCGVVLYEMATGRAPFHGKTTAAVLGAVMHETPPAPSRLNPQVQPKLEEIIHKALEKDREVRYQHASELRADLRRMKRDAELSAPSVPVRPNRRRPFGRIAIAGFLLAMLAAWLWLTRPLPPPHITGTTQITRDGQIKRAFVSDGTRLYYVIGIVDLKFFQVSANGGEPVRMPQFDGMFPLDVSPDRSQLLLAQPVKGTGIAYPLWVASALGSAPRRLGDLTTTGDARWSPKGDQIVYTSGAELRIARSDGAETRTLTKVDGNTTAPCWSPDGRSIRFTLSAKNTYELWEVSADGSHRHPLFPGWAQPQQDGSWTADGRYFVFSARQSTLDLWAVRESRRFLERARPAPARLTTGPLQIYKPTLSPDGKRIFIYGTLERGELVHYDPKSDRWTPYLSGLAATQLDYSRDGKWLTYVSFPEESVWRSALDGSQRLQLTPPSLTALNPRWSPDGTQIAFAGKIPGKPWRVYVVPAAGGAVRQLTHGESGPRGDVDAGWSPDGASLVFSTSVETPNSVSRDKVVLWIVDVRTGRISTLPGSQGLWTPRWSPDGRYISATASWDWKMMLYDVARHEQSKLAATSGGWQAWSPDSQFLYFEDVPPNAWYRVRIADRKLERLATFKGLTTTPSNYWGWVGPAPNGSLLATRHAGSAEIYALDWDAP